MIDLLPEQTAYAEFTLTETPDSLPTVAAYKVSADGVFGTASGMSETVVNVSGLSYYASAIVPEDAAPGDRYSLLVTVTVGGTASVFWLALGQVERGLTPEQAAWIQETHEKAMLIGTGMAVVSAPVNSEGSLDYLIVGDSYTAAHNRAFIWSVPVGTFGDLDGWTANFVATGVGCRDESTVGPIEGTITDAGLETQTVTFELSSDDSSVPAGTYRWSVYFEKDGERITPLVGNVAFRKP